MGIITKDKIDQALVEVREFIKSDGGDIEIVKIEGHKVFLKFKGACVGCPLSFMTLQHGIMQALHDSVSQDIEIEVVER